MSDKLITTRQVLKLGKQFRLNCLISVRRIDDDFQHLLVRVTEEFPSSLNSTNQAVTNRFIIEAEANENCELGIFQGLTK